VLRHSSPRDPRDSGTPYSYHRTIHDAISTESKSTVKLLLECGVRTDVLDDLGNSVILHTVVAGRWDFQEPFLEWGEGACGD